MRQPEIKDGKTLATVAYITPLGLLIAISLNLEKKNPYIFFSCKTNDWFNYYGRCF